MTSIRAVGVRSIVSLVVEGLIAKRFAGDDWIGRTASETRVGPPRVRLPSAVGVFAGKDYVEARLRVPKIVNLSVGFLDTDVPPAVCETQLKSVHRTHLGRTANELTVAFDQDESPLERTFRAEQVETGS